MFYFILVSWLQRGRGGFRGRGRGFGGGYVDMFRSRKQNTSRPPSMHVDDFIAMENNASPSESQGKQPIKVFCHFQSYLYKYALY